MEYDIGGNGISWTESVGISRPTDEDSPGVNSTGSSATGSFANPVCAETSVASMQIESMLAAKESKMCEMLRIEKGQSRAGRRIHDSKGRLPQAKRENDDPAFRIFV
jgi:hypothetical protein